MEYRIGETGDWVDYVDGILVTGNGKIYVHLKRRSRASRKR